MSITLRVGLQNLNRHIESCSSCSRTLGGLALGLARHCWRRGKSEAALAMVQQEVDEGNRLLHLPIVLQASGRKTEADEALNALTKRWGSAADFRCRILCVPG